MAEGRFGIILVLLLPILLCNATEDDIQTDDQTNVQTFVPSQDAIIQAQTEAIKRIMQAKSLELGNLNLSDSVLLTKCQQLARENEDKKQETHDERGDQDKSPEIGTEKNEHEPLESLSQIGEKVQESQINNNQQQIENQPFNTDNKPTINQIQVVNQVPQVNQLDSNPQIADNQQSNTENPQIVNQPTINPKLFFKLVPQIVPQLSSNQLQIINNPPVADNQQSTTRNVNPAQMSDKMDYDPQNDKSPHPEPQVITSPYGRTLYYIYHRFFPENIDQKVEPTTIPTTTTTTQASNEPVYAEKMRFVLRMPYPKREHLSGFPWEFDRYAYFPKSMQPDYVNAPLPYAPVYHMIRRLVVPSKVPGNFIVETNQ